MLRRTSLASSTLRLFLRGRNTPSSAPTCPNCGRKPCSWRARCLRRRSCSSNKAAHSSSTTESLACRRHVKVHVSAKCSTY